MLTVPETLEGIREKSIFFEPAGGNNGDTLIELGTRELFARLDLQVHHDSQNAEAIVINGGGASGVELWNQGLKGLRSYAQTFRAQPLVVLPSSFYFEGDVLAASFAHRTAPAYLFARDRYSYERLAAQTFPSEVRIGLAEDMAFALRGSALLEGLLRRVSARHILVVERFDVERATPGSIDAVEVGTEIVPSATEPALRRRLERYIPGTVTRAAKGVVHRRRVAASPFTLISLRRLYDHAPQYQGLPVLAQDISSGVGFTFPQFLDAIVNAAVVITTRLHVGILAALLNKPTYLVSQGARYPKLQGVYEYSMADLPHVHLW